MDILVYSDESGVFDHVHNDIFVFGGLIFLSKSEKEKAFRNYANAEKNIYNKLTYNRDTELKASLITNAEKGKLYRSLNQYEKFAVIVNQQHLNKNCFADKKTKQRYLDYAYKIGVKRKFESLIMQNKICPNEVNNITFNVDEHTTATNGRYELREGLLQELKLGTFNYSYKHHYPALFPTMNSVILNHCSSEKVRLVRAADIIANKVYHKATKDFYFLPQNKNIYITRLP